MLSFNPLFIGAWVRTHQSGRRQARYEMFQSPLHRGLGSDLCRAVWFSSRAVVSIPSSSGPGFGRKTPQWDCCPSGVSIPSSSGPGFGPDDGRLIVKVKKVSIPSSSGPGFGPRGRLIWQRILALSFNPLFIGAWVRTDYVLVLTVGHIVRFNPLFIGAWVRTEKIERALVSIFLLVSIPSSSGPGFGRRKLNVRWFPFSY